MTPSVLPADEGRLIDGKYRLEARIGDGAVGIVYRAEHVHLRRTVAVKLLSKLAPDAETVLRFRREAEALGRLHHPNVVGVVDFGIDPGERRPYLVMEYLEGVSLDVLIQRDGPLPLSRALPILQAVASGLDHAHAQGVLHRDLKPANVVLFGDVRAPHVKILDFGLAHLDDPGPEASPRPPVSANSPVVTSDLTASGALLGTPLYAAPEVFRGGAPTAASDVYSLGVLAYELLCGRPPFTGTTPEVMAGHLHAAPPDPAGFGVTLPPSILAAFRSLLAKDPTARPSGASEAVKGLAAAWLGIRQQQWRKGELPRRLTLAALIAAVTAAASPWLSSLEPIAALERRTEDVRFALRPRRPADRRILILSIDEDSLASASIPLAARPDEVSRVIEALFDAGAEGVALDFVLPAAWSVSPTFSELVVRHAERLRLAAMASASGAILGTECVAGLVAAALGPQGVSRLFGLVNVREDEDGRLREGRLFYRDASGDRRPSWAGAASSLLGTWGEHDNPIFVLDRAVDPSSFPSVPWAALPGTLKREPGLFRGKLVLIGGDRVTSGDDAHRLPSAAGRTRAVSGIVLQAMMVQTMLDGLPVRRTGQPWLIALAALGAASAAAACLTARTPTLGLLASGVLMAAMLALEALPFRWTGQLLPLVMPAGAALLAVGVALVARTRLTPYPGSRLET